MVEPYISELVQKHSDATATKCTENVRVDGDFTGISLKTQNAFPSTVQEIMAVYLTVHPASNFFPSKISNHNINALSTDLKHIFVDVLVGGWCPGRRDRGLRTINGHQSCDES